MVAVIGAFAATLAACATVPAGTGTAGDIRIAGDRVFPESITSDEAGNIYVGSSSGTIYRAQAGAEVAEPWIEPDDANGLQSLFGVLAEGGMLWACSNPGFGGPPPANPQSHLKAFDLATGALAANYAFPAGPAACNDIAVAADGTVFVTETAGGRIFRVAPGQPDLVPFVAREDLVGIDGIAFAGDGAMYINNVRANTMQRVERAADGSFARLTTLALSQPVSGPDGLRPMGGNRFLQAEGSGNKVTLVEITGDRATLTTLRDGLDSSPGVTRVGRTGYATEGKIRYLIDPAFREADPGPFFIRAFPLPEGL
jgi:sugar lactone lactonase YvrE